MGGKDLAKLYWSAKKDQFFDGVKRRKEEWYTWKEKENESGKGRRLREWRRRVKDDVIWFRNSAVMDFEDRFHR